MSVGAHMLLLSTLVKNGSMYSTETSLRFDVYTEKMEQITMPPRTINYLWNYLPVIRSRVYWAVRKAHAEADFHVVEMSSDFSKWVPKYDANISHLFYAFPEAICVVEGVKEDEPCLVLGIPHKLVSYNLKEKTAKELCELRGELSDINGYRSARFYHFIECLSDV